MTGDRPSITTLQQELQPILAGLEAQRIRVRNRALISGALVLAGMAIAAIALSAAIQEIGIVIGIIGGIIIWSLINIRPMRDYRTHFKQQVIHRLVQHYDPGLRYTYNAGITKAEFRNSQIYRHRIDSYRCEDLIAGKLGATTFRFSEVHAKYKTQTTDSKGHTQTHWHTLFRGIFFIADFNKYFKGSTLVVPDVAERSLGGLGQMLQGLSAGMKLRDGELIKLEDPEFERTFAVYSTDQVEARYILSTSLMQRLLDFRCRMNSSVALSFINSCVYIAIPTSKNYFEPPSIWFGSVIMTLQEIQDYLNEIKLAQDIIEDLNLNLRIWGKQ
jgi:hypothetical protein